MPSMSVYPATFAKSRPLVVTVTGVGTSWGGGTTFSSSDGAALITSLTINSTTSATMTLNPGPNAGTQTISNSSDAGTTTISVASTVTFAGSNATYSSVYQGIYDTDTPFTEDCVGHALSLSGGTGFTAGPYTISGFAGHVLVGGIFVDVAILAAAASPWGQPASTTATGGSWSYFMGPGGSGFGGGNLIPWSKDFHYLYDPDAPIASALNGAIIGVSGGSGFSAANYSVTAYSAAFNTSTNGIQNLAQTSVASATTGAFGATWIKNGGGTILTPTVNTTFTGAIKALVIGDSIANLVGSSTQTALEAQYPNASSVSVIMMGNDGSKTASWLIGASEGYLTAAISAANAAGTTIISIMLGTNDSGDPPLATASMTANMQAIVNSLFSGISTLQSIVLQEQPYIIPGTYGQWDASSNTALQAYFAAYSGITGAKQVIVGASNSNTNFAFFEANPQLLQDGVHPAPSGVAEINYTWLTSMAPAIAPTGPSITSITANSNGTLSLVFSESVGSGTIASGHFFLGDNSDGTFDGNNNVSLSGSYSGTGGLLALPSGQLFYPGMVYTLSYDVDAGIQDGSGNSLELFDDQAVTNSSTATVSIPSPFTAYALDNGAQLFAGGSSDQNVQVLVTVSANTTQTGLYPVGNITIQGVGQIDLANGTTYHISTQQVPISFNGGSGTPSASTSNITVTPPNVPAKPTSSAFGGMAKWRGKLGNGTLNRFRYRAG